MKKLLIALLALTATSVYAESWIVVNDTDAVKIEHSDKVSKTSTGFTGIFRKTDKAAKKTSQLNFTVDCATKFYDLNEPAEPGDEPHTISNGIANPDHKLYAYIEKGCK
jgi:hypothetical protein